ncbi:MAG: 1,6-anhydro-N-acetylmuramyl-L-alanine amidase AmpD [Steroidobacteraceae bacterium]
MTAPAVHRSTGLLTGVRQVLSPHRDARPADVPVDLIVLHGISLPPGEFGGPWIEQLFAGHLPCDAHPYFQQLRGVRVSAHVLVRRDGEAVQFVPLHERAWHAGASQYQGRTACNDFSIGIEFEGADDLPYEAAQYETGAALIRALLAAYPALDAGRIVGHSDIAPGRKTDPGAAFDWARLRGALTP